MSYVVCECPAFRRNDYCFEELEQCQNIKKCAIKSVIDKYKNKNPDILKILDVVEVEDD